MKRHASDRVLPPPPDDSTSTPADSSTSATLEPPRPDWLQEAERRLQGHRSLLETLTEDDWEFFRNDDGPEVLGPPPPSPMKRRPRRRGEA